MVILQKKKQRAVAFLADYAATKVATQIRMPKQPEAEFSTYSLLGCILSSDRQEVALPTPLRGDLVYSLCVT